MVSEDEVRTAALSLPETNEKSSYGMPGFRVRTKGFARLHEEPGVLVLWCADLPEKEALIASDPETFFTTPHYDGYSNVLVRLTRIDNEELLDLLTAAWRSRAPRRLLEEFDATA
ncbi:MAG: MmcQ/YjbR family DNA-binding protein [Actinomycetota bacterium]|nr:MmcQ/YjbR family DNA-binding protein [Actinomycetota bacterium]